MERKHCIDCKHWEPRRGRVGRCKVWEPRQRKDGSLTYNYYEASHFAGKKKFEEKENDEK